MTPEAGAFDGRVHRLPVRVYYEDTDFTGVVYHANYLKFFERGRSDFLRLAGVGHAALLDGETPLGFAVTRMTLAFQRAARIDDALVVRTRFGAMKGVRMTAFQQIARGDEPIASAEVEVVCISLDGRPRRLPPALRELLSPWMSDDDAAAG